LVSSDETKALETAAVVAAAAGLPIEVRSGLAEDDRSSTGFVSPSRFEQLADAFFAEPDVSVEGWETSRDAQVRVVNATSDLIADSSGDLIISGHGGVGTLLLCHLLGVPISRDHDQNRSTSAPGGGNHWAFDRDSERVMHGWQPIEDLIVSAPDITRTESRP
jgi:broad specificity phosphatase PhoE